MAVNKDSAVIVIQTAEDGFFVRVWRWGITPPPFNPLALEQAEPVANFQQDRVATSKTELKNEFGAFIDSVFNDF